MGRPPIHDSKGRLEGVCVAVLFACFPSVCPQPTNMLLACGPHFVTSKRDITSKETPSSIKQHLHREAQTFGGLVSK